MLLPLCRQVKNIFHLKFSKMSEQEREVILNEIRELEGIIAFHLEDNSLDEKYMYEYFDIILDQINILNRRLKNE